MLTLRNIKKFDQTCVDLLTTVVLDYTWYDGVDGWDHIKPAVMVLCDAMEERGIKFSRKNALMNWSKFRKELGLENDMGCWTMNALVIPAMKWQNLWTKYSTQKEDERELELFKTLKAKFEKKS